MTERFEEKLFLESKETQEVIKPKIFLHFFRHAEEQRETGMKDIEVPLSKKGKELAFKKGEELKPQKKVAIGVGSPKQRTIETVARVIGYPEITPEMDWPEIEELFKKHLKIGKKITEDKRLQLWRVGEIEKRSLEALQAGKILEFIVFESDRLAKELGDEESLTYAKMASNIAEIILKYLRVFGAWDKINRKFPDKYQKYQYQLERYLCSHQTVLGSFIAKIIEKTEGKQKRNDYVISMRGEGLKRLEGFTIEIIKEGEVRKCFLVFKMGDETKKFSISEQLLEEIIKEK